MGGGLAFLTKKQFNPSNISNQKRVWEAEQRSISLEVKNKEREKQLQSERDHEELLRATHGKNASDKASLRFMYDAPPSSKKNDTTTGKGQDEVMSGERFSSFKHSQVHDEPTIFKRQEGDDDAAAAFRQMLAAQNLQGSSSQRIDDDESDLLNRSNISANNTYASLVLTGSTAEISKKNAPLTQLEKAVGKKHDGGSSGLTLQEQITRFPQLKNAPMVLRNTHQEDTAATENLTIKFQPLGAQIRNIRCLKCGVWGHSRGDRECALSGWDPFSMSGSKTVNCVVETISASDNIVETRDSALVSTAQTYEDSKHHKISGKRGKHTDDETKSRHKEHGPHSSDDETKRDAKSKKRKKEKRKKKSSYHYRSSSDDDDCSRSTDSRRRRRRRHR